jgi:hypothetical protein
VLRRHRSDETQRSQQPRFQSSRVPLVFRSVFDRERTPFRLLPPQQQTHASCAIEIRWSEGASLLTGSSSAPRLAGETVTTRRFLCSRIDLVCVGGSARHKPPGSFGEVKSPRDRRSVTGRRLINDPRRISDPHKMTFLPRYWISFISACWIKRS